MLSQVKLKLHLNSLVSKTTCLILNIYEIKFLSIYILKVLFYIYIYICYKNSLIAKKDNRIFQLKYTKEQFEKSGMQIKAVNIKIPQLADTLYIPSTFSSPKI